MSEVANSFKVIGLLTKVFPTERKSDKFQCRDFVIEVAGQYPEFIKFQLTQDRCDLIDAYTEGADEIEVSFNVTGREWQGKYFTTLNAWKVKKVKDVEVQEMLNQTPYEQSVPPILINELTGQVVKFGGLDTKAVCQPLPNADEPLKAADTDDLPF